MAIGDIVSGYGTSFQPAAGISVLILFAGIPNGGGGVGITDGSSSSKVVIPATPYNTYSSESRGIGIFKIPIINSNYLACIDGYSGIQIE